MKPNIVLLFAVLSSQPAHAATKAGPELVVVGVHGPATSLVPTGRGDRAPNDAIMILDASRLPVTVVKQVAGLDHSILGPPQSVAITPDGAFAFVSSPTSYNFATKKEVPGTTLQIVRVADGSVTSLDLGSNPNGLAISPDGTLLLAACTDGTVKVLAIRDGVRLVETTSLTASRLSGVAISPDGRFALVAHRDEGGLSVLDIAGGKVTLGADRITTGVGPLAIAMSGDGRYAAVGNMGMTTLLSVRGRLAGDADSVTLIDLSRRPFRAVQHITVPSAPEGVALSADGRFLAVQTLGGSHLPAANPGHRDIGQISLFRVAGGMATLVNSVAGGGIAQGLVFSRDGHRLLVDFNLEKAIAVFEVSGGRLRDTGQRIQAPGGAVSIATTPR